MNSKLEAEQRLLVQNRIKTVQGRHFVRLDSLVKVVRRFSRGRTRLECQNQMETVRCSSFAVLKELVQDDEAQKAARKIIELITKE